MANTIKTCDLLERLSTLFRNEVRQAGLSHGLHPVHLEVLYYLSRCNLFSDTPAAVKDFLGTTKGTTSQSITLLENKGYLTKTKDAQDKRVYHLSLTDAGKDIADQTMPPPSLRHALERCSNDQSSTLEQQLEALLIDIQNETRNVSFGLCKTCIHHAPKNQTLFLCQLTQKELPRKFGELICREHQLKVVSDNGA
ncbi:MULTISPECIES: MarR family winged helix-turn-helix transcriptional regulator [unclassified Motilimonas]|uniref:MarR family winged helix-turn-helix transcriptional regulator n=1 Tax=Motilimonas TaxID=1914248 RepID=UPI001E53C879|nr:MULTISPECIES: MarR family winged helix-turn-helix transcriptional regulator [unclassified Motilimonas]MCE0557134.1 MarR family winged helix-turn-helix transcriptional regulator [Motilimonas sp. E26]MDO6524369.1 MarR family winged helix-turn-helix transcriptional regulator [Motilimonas sp. 1_MG-2023]